VTYAIDAIRRDIPALADVVYMNYGTEGVMAESVLAPYIEMLSRFERYGHFERMKIADEMTRCHETVALLVKCRVEEVAITRNGTDGVSMVLGSFPFREGDELLIGGEEHPAIVYPAFALQRHRGVRVRRFAFHDDPAQTLAAFASALTPRTRVVAFSHVSCETGKRTPARAIVAAAQARGARVLVDGAQTIGWMDVDFPALGADYLTGSAHKWLCGPKGSGILIVHRDRLDELVPAYVGGGSFGVDFPWTRLDRPEEIHAEWAAGATRFEYGMRNPALYAGLRLAIDHMSGIGWDEIRRHQRRITDALKARLAAIPGVRVQTPADFDASSPILNFAVDGISGRDLSQRLWNEHRVVQRAVREPMGVRLSNGYCTSTDDHDRLVAAIEAIRRVPVPA